MVLRNRIAQLTLVILLGLLALTARSSGQQMRPLEPNKPIAGEFRKDEKQSFSLSLKPLDYARVTVDARGAELSITLFAPDGKPVAEYLRPLDGPNPVGVSLVAGYSGNYRIEILSRQEDNSPKAFSVTLAELRPIEKLDAERIEAERRFAAGERIRAREVNDGRRPALADYQEALKLWRAAGDREKEAMALGALGGLSTSLREHQQALDYFNQALALRRSLKDRKREAGALFNIGRTHQEMKQYKQALEAFHLALPLWREAGDQKEEASVITEIGATQSAAGDQQDALKTFEQALAAWQKAGDQNKVAEIYLREGRVYEALNNVAKALEVYGEALKLYRATNDRLSEASVLLDLGVVNRDAGKNKQALEYLQQALPIWRSLNQKGAEASTLNYLGIVSRTLGEKQTALEYYEKALALARELNQRGLQARLLNNMATVYADLGEKRKALELLKEVLPSRSAATDRASTLISMGAIYSDLGENQLALEHFNLALLLSRENKLADYEEIALQSIGVAYDQLGEKQKSLDHYLQALSLARQIKAKQDEGTIQINLAALYSSLGEKQKALDYYLQALKINRETNNRSNEADTLHQLGFLYFELEEYRKALDYLNQALPIWSELKDPRGEAITLTATGMVYRSLGERQKSLTFTDRALPLHRSVGNRVGEAEALINKGLILSAAGEKQTAIEQFNQAAELGQAVADPSLEAKARYEIARVNLDSGEFDRSRTQIEEALRIVESLRTKVASQELRASYFATVQKFYDFYIELLMRMHDRESGKGFNGEALQASERARARGLLEILAEANANIREGVDAKLIERERNLQQQINGRADVLFRLYTSKPSPEQVAALRKEIDELTAQYGEVRAQIRRASPRYAALTQPSPLSLKEIQQQVLDDGTLLLEYSLGERRSFLWVVTPTKISSYVLPPRARIEAAARQTYELLSKLNGATRTADQQRILRTKTSKTNPNKQHAQAITAFRSLSRMLLLPVASQLGGKRLLIVASGALQYVPFAALSAPTKDRTGKSQRRPALGKPLIADHEIVYLPSASTLAVLRQEIAARQLAPKTLAVIADPVFEKDDERVKTVFVPAGGQPPERQEAATAPLPPVAEERSLKHLKEKSAEQTGVMQISRLPYTKQEAESILSLVPESERKQALDFNANRATATGNDLSQYRYVHFATHGYLDSERPEFSALVLSLVNEKGAPQSGFLYANEVYNLKLPAEVVTLSACETGLGKEIKGEGLVGLTRGFMYAGAPRVVVSLWAVNDRATSELMARFYQKMLKENLRPAAALRAAQVEMSKDRRWNNPYYWAAFALQGEWR